MITKKVFLETNALYALGPTLENVDLAQLQEQRNVLEFKLLIAETSWREYLRHRQRELSDCLTKNRQSRSLLEKHVESGDVFEQTEARIKNALASVEERYQKRAAQLGFEIVAMPTINVRTLLDMALAGEPPFELADSGGRGKEKGFRDATIMFTILESMRGEDDVLIVTADTLLKLGIQKRAKEYEANPRIVETIAEAVKTVNEGVYKWYKEKKAIEAKDAIELLLQHRQEIIARVQDVRELSEVDLGQSGFTKALSGRQGEQELDIARVISLEFKEISSAAWQGSDEPVSKVFFKVECTAHVLASPRRFYWPQRPTFAVGGEKREIPFWGTPIEREPPAEHAIPVQLYGEATFERREDDWHLSSMKLEKSFSEEWLKSQVWSLP